MPVYVNGTNLKTKFGNYLAKDNAEVYTPTDEYNPATKKYTDEMLGGVTPNTVIHDQVVPQKIWTITNTSSKIFPSVTIVDSAGSVVQGEIKYSGDGRTITITFTASFSGKAYLN